MLGAGLAVEIRQYSAADLRGFRATNQRRHLVHDAVARHIVQLGLRRTARRRGTRAGRRLCGRPSVVAADWSTASTGSVPISRFVNDVGGVTTQPSSVHKQQQQQPDELPSLYLINPTSLVKNNAKQLLSTDAISCNADTLV